MGRTLVEDCVRLDIRKLKRNGWRYGWRSLSFTNGETLELVGTRDLLRVVRRADRGLTSSEIQIVRASVHFGGEREWLKCPVCERRFDILYMVSWQPRCRRCNHLAYQTQNEEPAGRQLIKAGRLWKRAGHEFGGEGQKPKFMQWHTYNRLMERAEEAYGASWDRPFIRRMMAKLDG